MVPVGHGSGDLVHPLPYCPEFFLDEFKSKVRERGEGARRGGEGGEENKREREAGRQAGREEEEERV